MIESAPMLETLNKSSLNRPRPITVSEYSANKLSSCLATPGLTSGDASLASSAMASHRLAPTFAANTGNNNDSGDCATPRSYQKPTTPTAAHRAYNSTIKPTTRFKITCKSSNYNSKDIANSLYDIDDHLNKDLIYDFFFNDNYMLDNLTLNSNNYSCVNTFKDKENYNSNNSNVNTNQPWALHRTETSSNNLSTRDYNSLGNHQPTNTSTNTNNNNTSSNSTSNNNINTNNSNSNNSNGNSNNNANNTISNNNSNNNNGSTANNNNNSNNGGKQTLVAWENSTNKCMQFSDWNDGLNEWCAMPPYPSLRIYMNSIKNRRGLKQRTEVEFDEQLGLYLPTFKIIQKQLQQQQQQQQQQKEQLQQLQQQSTDTNYHHHHHHHHHQHGNNNQHSSHQQNHPSTRLIKELHKLVNSNPNNNTPLVKFDENNNSGQTSNLSNTSTSSIVNKKELQLQQQFIYVNSIINDQRQQQQQQQQQLHSSNQFQRQNSGHMKRSLHVRAAFPSLMNNSSNNNSNFNINNTNNNSTSNLSNQLNHVENNNASSANTLLATQLLQLRSDEIDRLTQSAKNNSATNLVNVINVQNQIHHSHASLSASSLLKQSNISNNSSSALTPNSVTLHHAASTNSVANKTAPLIVGDDMNLIRVKKITQQQTEASPTQDNITKQLLMNNAVQQQIQSNLVRNKTDNISDNHNLSISNNTNALFNHKNNNSNNNNNNNNNNQKQSTQIISISSSSNLNASNTNLIGTPNAKVYKAAQPITTASTTTPNASSSSSSTTSSTSTSAGSMSSTSQSASQSSPNASTINSYTAYQSNDPRYRLKSTDDELSSHGTDFLAKQQKNSTQKVIVPVTLSNRYNPTTPNSCSLLTTNIINSKQNNDTILNPFFVNQTNNTLISENTQILLNSADVIIAHQQLPQQQQQQQQNHQHHHQPQPQQHTMTAALPPIISGKRINLPLGPHRRRIVMDYLDSGGKLNKQQGSITCRKNKNGASNAAKSARVTRSTSFQESKSKLPSSANSRSLPKSLLNSGNGIKIEMQPVSIENEPKCRKVIAKSHKQPNPPAAAPPASKDKNIKIVNSILIRSHTFYF